ncbi:MAG TPA: hypothetical protein VGM87_13970 [Roseomonas sp.]|jgi:hypothetical protein
MKGLLDAPSGHAVAPRRTRVRGTPHHLAYINADEHALLRRRGGGVTDDGGQLLGPAGVPAYDGGGSGDGGGDGGSGAGGAGDGAGGDGGGDGGVGDRNYIGPVVDEAAARAAAEAKAALLARLSAPIDQTQRSFVAGGTPGAPAGPVPSYNYGSFTAAPPVIGAMQPLPAPAQQQGAPPATPGQMPPVPNVGLPSYAPPAFGMQPDTLARLRQVGVLPDPGAMAGYPTFSGLLGRMR